MAPLTSIKNVFDLLKSAHAAWPTLLIVVGAVTPFVVNAPPYVWVVCGLLLLASLLLVGYRLRRHIQFVPFHEASQRAYEKLQGTLWATAADRMHDQPSPEKSLQYMGQLLINDGKLGLYGVRPPSRAFLKIDAKTMEHAVVEDECKKLVSADRKDLPWVDLMVKRKEFKVRLKDMRASALEQPKFKTLRDSINSALGVGYEVKEDPLHQRILKEIASGDGSLDIINFLKGVSYTVRNGQHQRRLNNGNDAKEIAELEDAVEELEQKRWIRLVNQTANSDRFYKVTGAGYKEAGQ